jgi:hypothetical protein
LFAFITTLFLFEIWISCQACYQPHDPIREEVDANYYFLMVVLDDQGLSTKENSMKKIMFLLFALLLAAFPATAYADGGINKNPNSFEVDAYCGEQIIHMTVPTSYGFTPGLTDDNRVAHPRTYKEDWNGDGVWEVNLVLSQGRGFNTIFCTWTWDRDSYLHGMDIQFVPK